MAFHDPLTGLLNRRAVLERLDYLMALSKRHKRAVALLFIDLDNFKMINDSFGHTIGDGVLIHVARLLETYVRKTDVIGRIGGDEFVVLLTDLKEEAAAERVAEKLIESLKAPFEVDGVTCKLTCSIGCALAPKHTEVGDQLLQYADAAMYAAKERGKNRYCCYDEEIGKRLIEQLRIVEEVERAIDGEYGRIVLYFQPQIDISSGEVRGAEVLTRWEHPERGLLFPGEYIPTIERSPVMFEYDRFVIRAAFAQLAEWMERGYRWKIGLNLTAHQFNDGKLLQFFDDLVRRYGVDPALVELEVTESLPMEDVEVSIARLKALKEMGFRISIDDFGTGYSSLSYLKRLPFDVLKIDREFIKDLHEDEEDVVIVKLMIQIARTLGKSVVAEGPEMEEHIRILKALSCDYAQGYYYSKPIPTEAFVAFATGTMKGDV